MQQVPARTKTIRGYTYDTSRALKLAASRWKDFPSKGEDFYSELYRDEKGNYFVLEHYSWFKDQIIIPKTKKDAELYYLLYADEIFNRF